VELKGMGQFVLEKPTYTLFVHKNEIFYNISFPCSRMIRSVAQRIAIRLNNALPNQRNSLLKNSAGIQ
jgi:hypothetical protein